MSPLTLSMAIGPYDHVADLVRGHVHPEGIELRCLTYRVEEIFFRMLMYRDFDISELSMAKYVTMLSQGDDSLVGIPVFPSRVPRHSSIYVRRDGSIKKPEDLKGRRIGLPEWAQTAAVYSRGMMAHHYGVDLASIDWVQAGVDQAGRIEKVKLKLPGGIKITPQPEKNLSDMLVAGELDAVMSAAPPGSFKDGHPNIKRLFDNPYEEEVKYVQETGIFPIMHAIVIRKELVDRNPWIPMNLFTAFEEAKRRSVERALFGGWTAFPIPWAYEHARRAKEMFGGELWPYGIERNRKTLDPFLTYLHEQGLTERRYKPEEIFARQVQQTFRA